MKRVCVAATQMACSLDKQDNLDNAKKLVMSAAEQGANIILLQELFHTVYFCQVAY
jgi:N-carbamoylputrescine amidase